MTTQDCITRARYLLTDNPEIAEQRRWNDAELILFCADAVLVIWSLRLDSRLSAAGTLITFAETTAVTDTLVIADRWRPAVVDYICFRAYQMPSGERENRTRSNEHWKSFTDHMGIM